MISSYVKVFSIGTQYIKDIFNEDVECTEKADGSMFGMGKVNGILYIRSKGAQLYQDKPEGMFKEGIEYITSIEDRLPDNLVFYGEYLRTKKHNTLCYSRIPKNHIILFGVMDLSHKFLLYPEIKKWADYLDLETVPLLFQGRINSAEELQKFLELESILGGTKIEGVVVKNYHRQFLLGGQPIPLMAGKYVSEAFKEKHSDRWGKEETHKGKLETFIDSFCTEARWRKAVQHLKELSLLENSPRDIGRLIKEVQADIEIEDQEDVKEFLWKEFKGNIFRKSIAGFPEWYKKYLLEQSFEKEIS